MLDDRVDAVEQATTAIREVMAAHYATGDEFDVEVMPGDAFRIIEDTSWMEEPYDGDEDAA